MDRAGALQGRQLLVAAGHRQAEVQLELAVGVLRHLPGLEDHRAVHDQIARFGFGTQRGAGGAGLRGDLRNAQALAALQNGDGGEAVDLHDVLL